MVVTPAKPPRGQRGGEKKRAAVVWVGGDSEVGKQILFEDDLASELSEII